MSYRTIDPTRQGIAASESASADGPCDAAPVSIEEALAAVAGWKESGMTLFGLHQVAVALSREVERLQKLVDVQQKHLASTRRIAEQRADQAEEAIDELELHRAALPGIIGCFFAEVEICTRTNGNCCWRRMLAVKYGLLPAPAKSTEAEDRG